jgi:hypothetical protein
LRYRINICRVTNGSHVDICNLAIQT